MTPTQALSRLLQGSGMTYRFVDAKTVTVERPAGNDEKAVEPQSATLPAVKVSGTAEYAPYDPYNPSYNTPNASTATKTDTPIMETPLAIKVVPQQVLKDQQVTRLEDVYRNVSGVQAGFGYSNFYDDASFAVSQSTGIFFATVSGSGIITSTPPTWSRWKS